MRLFRVNRGWWNVRVFCVLELIGFIDYWMDSVGVGIYIREINGKDFNVR